VILKWLAFWMIVDKVINLSIL